MKAAVLTHYDKKGTDLEIQDLPVPVPEDDQILVHIMAAPKGKQSLKFMMCKCKIACLAVPDYIRRCGHFLGPFTDQCPHFTT